jgi:predicted P-loop ATPase
MVPNGFKVKADWIGEVRDKVWGAALNAYRAGISNQLPEDLLFAAEEEALEFCEEDVLTTPISTYLANQIQVTLWEVAKALGFDADHISMPDQRRIGKIMAALGWEKKRVMAGSSKITCWVKND